MYMSHLERLQLFYRLFQAKLHRKVEGFHQEKKAVQRVNSNVALQMIMNQVVLCSFIIVLWDFMFKGVHVEIESGGPKLTPYTIVGETSIKL